MRVAKLGYISLLLLFKKFVRLAQILATMKDVIEDYVIIDRQWWFLGVVDLINRCPKLSYLSVGNCQNIGDNAVVAAINRAKRNPSDFELNLIGCDVSCFIFFEN